MKVYINERSIDRQAKDHQEAMSILTTLAKVVSKSKSIAFESKSFRTKCFLDKEIINGVTVKSVLVQAVAKQSASEELARKFTLLTLMSRPHTEDRHLEENDTIHDEVGTCLKTSCFDDAAESISGSLMISAINNHKYTGERISYSSSLYGNITWRRQKLSATPDLSGRVLPCLITNSALKNAPISRSVCCVA